MVFEWSCSGPRCDTIGFDYADNRKASRRGVNGPRCFWVVPRIWVR